MIRQKIIELLTNVDPIVLTAIATALCTQLTIYIYDIFRNSLKRRSIRRLFLADVKRLDEILKLMHDDFIKMANQLQSLQLPNRPALLYPTFKTDIYKSVSLPDINEAFGKDFFLVVTVYDQVEYRAKTTPTVKFEYFEASIDGLVEGRGSKLIEFKNECLNDRDNIKNTRDAIAELLSKHTGLWLQLYRYLFRRG